MAPETLTGQQNSANHARSPRPLLLLRTMRLRQWVKNVFVLSPLLFSQHLFDIDIVSYAVAGFFLFSLMASAIYLSLIHI